MASICCSPPLRVPPFWFRLSFNRGKISQTHSKSFWISVFFPSAEGAHPQILLDGHAGKDPPSLRGLGYTHLHHFIGRPSLNWFALEEDLT